MSSTVSIVPTYPVTASVSLSPVTSPRARRGCATVPSMGLFRRSKKRWHPSMPADGAADPLEEQEEAHESGRGALGPQTVGPPGSFPLGTVANDPLAREELRAAADSDDDEAESSLVERERRQAEHGDEPSR